MTGKMTFKDSLMRKRMKKPIATRLYKKLRKCANFTPSTVQNP